MNEDQQKQADITYSWVELMQSIRIDIDTKI